jgi:hypothetical protein
MKSSVHRVVSNGLKSKIEESKGKTAIVEYTDPYALPGTLRFTPRCALRGRIRSVASSSTLDSDVSGAHYEIRASQDTPT